MSRPYALIAGGGTGGHVSPALAVARALVAHGHAPEDIGFVGSRRGLEARLVPEAGFPITLLPGRGIQRRLTFENVGAVAGLAVAVVRAVTLVARNRPRVVVSVGGYASVPCAVAAVLLRVPLVLVGLDAHPGAALKLVARFAAASAVAFPGTPLPKAEVTGNPVRPEILAVDRDAGRAEARRLLGLPEDRWVVAAFGGSLGARRINDAVLGAVGAWTARDDLAIRHVVGERDWTMVEGRAPDGALIWQPVRYEDRMDLLYAAADVAVCRAGATTVAELTVVGLPAVYVPSPYVTADHQTANARAVVDAGGGVLVPDAELTADRLCSELDALLAEPGRLAVMGKAAAGLGRPDAADRVASLVERVAAP